MTEAAGLEPLSTHDAPVAVGADGAMSEQAGFAAGPPVALAGLAVQPHPATARIPPRGPMLRRANGPPIMAAAGPDTGDDEIASKSPTDKLLAAWEAAKPHLAKDAVAQLEGLMTPESLGMMAGFTVAYVVAQATPVGWVADGVALASLGVTAFFEGKIVLDVTRDLMDFAAAVNAHNKKDIERAGAALSHAIATGGMVLVTELVTHAISAPGGGKGAAAPSEAPPGYVDALTTDGRIVRAPAEAAERMPGADAASPGLPEQKQAATSSPAGVETAPASSEGLPPEPASESGTAEPAPTDAARAESTGPPAAPGAARGEEIWGEITAELGLGEDMGQDLGGELGVDPPSAGRPKRGAGQAAADAEAGGLIGKGGKRRGTGGADIAVQKHSQHQEVTKAYGTTGKQVESAHIGATGILEHELAPPGTGKPLGKGPGEPMVVDRPNYSRSKALTTMLPKKAHTAFDAYWKRWVRQQRNAGNPTASVAAMRRIMHEAIDQIPGLERQAKGALSWQFERELVELGLKDTDTVVLPRIGRLKPKPAAGASAATSSTAAPSH